MNKIDLQRRTFTFAISVYKLVGSLPPTIKNLSIYDQIIRSSASVASNYRAACRSKSYKDFSYKMAVVLEEIDESFFWLEYLEAIGVDKRQDIEILKNESNQLTAIFATALKTIKDKQASENLKSNKR